MRALFLAPLLWAVSASAQIAPVSISADFREWRAAGETNLFAVDADRAQVTWDSSKPNSYLHLPLGMTLTRADDFALRFEARVDQLQLGSTPGKPYTFQIAFGLLNLTHALDPSFYRGSGINTEHGPRNIIEFDYFPVSGPIAATLAPTISTKENEILFSDNHPMELEIGRFYRVEMAFSSSDQTLRTRLWKGKSADGSPEFESAPIELKPLLLGPNYADFAVDSVAVISYSDAGQSAPQFAGSIRASGVVQRVEVMVYNRPKLEIVRTGKSALVTFGTAAGWKYQVETSATLSSWTAVGSPLAGTGGRMELPVEVSEISRGQFFRVSGERL